jgi:hypothetical protein
MAERAGHGRSLDSAACRARGRRPFPARSAPCRPPTIAP